MTQIQSVQGGTTLSSLLATQLSSKSTGSQSSTASSTSPTSSDTVTLSLAALQALLGQGTDPTQLLQSQTQATYSATNSNAVTTASLTALMQGQQHNPDTSALLSLLSGTQSQDPLYGSTDSSSSSNSALTLFG